VADSYHRAMVEDTVFDLSYRIVIRDGSIRNVRTIARRVSPPEVTAQIWQGLSIVQDPAANTPDPDTASEPAQVPPAMVNPSA